MVSMTGTFTVTQEEALHFLSTSDNPSNAAAETVKQIDDEKQNGPAPLLSQYNSRPAIAAAATANGGSTLVTAVQQQSIDKDMFGGLKGGFLNRK